MLSMRALLTALAVVLVTGSVLVLGASAASPWPTCFGEPATIVGTEGNDTINGTSGDDVIVALGGDDVVTSGGADEQDKICGGDGNDSLIVTGEAWNVMLSGDAGDDRIQGNKGTLFVEADYENSPEPVNVNLGAGTESGWGTDTLVRVSFVDGSQYDDVLTGSAGSDGLDGGPGNDTLSGLGSMDDLVGGPGDDTIDGGAGYDWLDYWNAPTGVHVSLAKRTASGGGGKDTFRSIENVYGSKHADVLVGGSGANHLEGNSGNDKLYGGKGKDTLIGDGGKDHADGGPARDVCRAEHKLHCP
jgi:serralysin